MEEEHDELDRVTKCDGNLYRLNANEDFAEYNRYNDIMTYKDTQVDLIKLGRETEN
jgi:protein tyrosine phosphatase